MSRCVLCLDLRESAGKVFLAYAENGKIRLELVEQFPNVPITSGRKLYWDFHSLLNEIEKGMQKAYEIAPYESIGIDTWGVDYGILDGGKLRTNPRNYRDNRTLGASKRVARRIGAKELYQRTGIQIMDINTLFQLMRHKEKEGLDEQHRFLMMPDLFAYFLTGVCTIERSIASTTQMVSRETENWDEELLTQLEIPVKMLPAIVPSGSTKGVLTEKVQERLGLPPIQVTAVCGHNTQCSAFAAVPPHKKTIFLSCGAWSLFGTEREEPILTERAAELGLSNETGYNGRTTLLKNIIGLWMLQETRRYFAVKKKVYTFEEIRQMAENAGEAVAFVNPDDSLFIAPGDIGARVLEYCRQTGQQVPENDGQMFRVIYESLAMKYRVALDELCAVTGDTYTEIHLAGQGAEDPLLCQLTANTCGLPVYAGPVEATIYGNAAIQFLNLGVFQTEEEARNAIVESETIQVYQPQGFRQERYAQFLSATQK